MSKLVVRIAAMVFSSVNVTFTRISEKIKGFKQNNKHEGSSAFTQKLGTGSQPVYNFSPHLFNLKSMQHNLSARIQQLICKP